MKRKTLVKKLTGLGCILHRHGGHHDIIYLNPENGRRAPVSAILRFPRVFVD